MNTKFEIDFAKVKSIVEGMAFAIAKTLGKTDKRFSYGASDGSNGDNMVDLNFGSILVTIENCNGKAIVLNKFEKYEDGQMIGIGTC